MENLKNIPYKEKEMQDIMIEFYLIKRTVTKTPLANFQVHASILGASSPSVPR